MGRRRKRGRRATDLPSNADRSSMLPGITGVDTLAVFHSDLKQLPKKEVEVKTFIPDLVFMNPKEPINNVYIGDTCFTTVYVLSKYKYISKEHGFLNFGTTVHFEFLNKRYEFKFNSWNPFKVPSDAECDKKLIAALIEKDKI